MAEVNPLPLCLPGEMAIAPLISLNTLLLLQLVERMLQVLPELFCLAASITGYCKHSLMGREHLHRPQDALTFGLPALQRLPLLSSK